MSHGSNNPHSDGNNNKNAISSNNDNDSVMTGGTFMVMARPDGTRSCVKHPDLTLDGWACPECEKEFEEAGNALQQRKANLDSRLQEFDGHGRGGNSPVMQRHSNMAQQQQQQQQQSQSPYMMPFMGHPNMQQTPPSFGNMNGMNAMHGSFQNMSLNGPGGNTPSSASLETLALQINRMQQMQDWMLLQKEREVQMLRQELAENQQRLHKTQMENALLQEKMIQMKMQYEQEIRLIQLTAAAHGNGNVNSLSNPNKNTDYDDHDAPHAAKQSPTNKESKDGTISRSNTNGTRSTGTTNATVPAAAALKVPTPPSRVTTETAAATSPSTSNSATPKAAPKNNNGDGTSAKKVTQSKAAPSLETKKQSPSSNKAATPPSGDRAQSAPGPKLKQAPSSANKAGSGGKNAYGVPTDINVDDDAPPAVPLHEDITLGTLGKNQSWRAGTLEARATRSDRFEPKYVGNVDESKDMKDTSTFEDTTFFPSNDQQSLTVASSTYGEDRQKVANQSLLDPYGDKGIYTGLILKSTGMPHGSGRMVYEEDQRIYEGEWRHGRWHGFGKAQFANGDEYSGEYRFDQRHGHGKYSWADGRSYDGEFSEDRRHGKGLFLWPDGAIYDGEFANGQREGHGTYKFSDGGEYTGSWKDGRYNGFGTCVWEDGRTYRGEWRNGMAWGKGVETYADGTVRHDGMWIEDTPVD